MRTDPETLEDRVERSRASLAETIERLQDRVSVDHLARDAIDTVRANASGLTRTLDRAVHANPGALALIGVGVAWLFLGGSGGNGRDESGWDEDNWSDDRSGGAREGWRAGWDDDWDEAGQYRTGGYGSDRYGSGQYPSGERFEDRSRFPGGRFPSGASRGYDPYGGSDLYGGGRMGMERAGYQDDDRRYGGGSDWNDDWPDEDEPSESLRERLSHGLEDLSAEARDRVSAAREKAYRATLAARRAAETGARSTGRMIEDHPLVAALSAAAIGGAIAAALPRSQVEDRYLGAERDRLVDEARRILAEERDRAARIASGAAEELREGVRATADAVTEEMRDTGEAVRSRIEEEAARGGD
jgi:ElaB/YqjD/DUF883 family membrane-anchored ribosome-binding protein